MVRSIISLECPGLVQLVYFLKEPGSILKFTGIKLLFQKSRVLSAGGKFLTYYGGSKLNEICTAFSITVGDVLLCFEEMEAGIYYGEGIIERPCVVIYLQHKAADILFLVGEGCLDAGDFH